MARPGRARTRPDVARAPADASIGGRFHPFDDGAGRRIATRYLRVVAATPHEDAERLDGIVREGRRLETPGMGCAVPFGDRVAGEDDLATIQSLELDRGVGCGRPRGSGAARRRARCRAVRAVRDSGERDHAKLPGPSVSHRYSISARTRDGIRSRSSRHRWTGIGSTPCSNGASTRVPSASFDATR